MQTVVLVVHLILALLLILIVLMQRSEGGGLGMGGGGGGGAMTGRQAANALTKITWVLAAGFLVTSLSLTIIAAQQARTDSVIERIGTETGTTSDTPPAPEGLGGNLLPPAATDSPALPPKAE